MRVWSSSSVEYLCTAKLSTQSVAPSRAIYSALMSAEIALTGVPKNTNGSSTAAVGLPWIQRNTYAHDEIALRVREIGDQLRKLLPFECIGRLVALADKRGCAHVNRRKQRASTGVQQCLAKLQVCRRSRLFQRLLMICQLRQPMEFGL